MQLFLTKWWGSLERIPCSQVLCHKMLLWLRDGQITQDDWRHFMNRTLAQVQDLSPFEFNTALCLFPTTEPACGGTQHFQAACLWPAYCYTVKAVHTGPNSSKALSDDAYRCSCDAILQSVGRHAWDWSMAPWEPSKPSAIMLVQHASCMICQWQWQFTLTLTQVLPSLMVATVPITPLWYLWPHTEEAHNWNQWTTELSSNRATRELNHRTTEHWTTDNVPIYTKNRVKVAETGLTGYDNNCCWWLQVMPGSGQTLHCCSK